MTNSVNTAIPLLEARALSCSFDSIRALNRVDFDARSGEVEALTRDTGLRQASRQGKSSLVGFDAKPRQLVALKVGTVQARDAHQPARISIQGVDQAIDALNGTKTTQVIQTGDALITQKNLATVGKEYAYESK